MRTRRAKHCQRRGAAVVEFALVIPVMLVFTFGMIELSRMSMVKESLTQASREGARIGVRPTATIEAIRAGVAEELEILGLATAQVTVTPEVLSEAMPGDNVRVEVSIPFSDASWVPNFFEFSTSTIKSETVMRRESTG